MVSHLLLVVKKLKFMARALTLKNEKMKKRIIFVVLLFLQIMAMAQQPANKKPASEVFEDGYRYLNGIGSSYDPIKAVHFFQRGAAAGDGASLNALGNLHLRGEAGLEKNTDAAIAYYMRAGAAGYGPAYYNLAILYKEDKILNQDFVRSAEYARTGASLGDNSCKKLLAYYYFITLFTCIMSWRKLAIVMLSIFLAFVTAMDMELARIKLRQKSGYYWLRLREIIKPFMN
jgi:TPR repeat protein